MSDDKVIVRLAKPGDVAQMSHLWQEKVIIQQQTDRRYRMAADGPQQWAQVVTAWLSDPAYVVCVAQSGADVVGYIIAQVQPGPPGLLPERIGMIIDVAVGVHSYQSGLGRHLLVPVRTWFLEQQITVVMANVPHRQPVEQAFWRAVGATEWMDLMWMAL